MTRYVSAHRPTAADKRRALRTALDQPGVMVAPGVFDGLSAIVAESAGARAVYVSGGAVSRSAGVPDLGLVAFPEMRDRIRDVVKAVGVPVIADADTGYGGPFNVMRTVDELEDIGVAALHLEDQADPKRCGHYPDKTLVPAAEMSAKIRAAVHARRDHDLVIIARTDALAVEGFDAALQRAEQYGEAGADALFVEAPETVEQIRTIPGRLRRPVLINMFQGGKTPLLDAGTLAGLGYKIMIVPSDLQRAALHAMRETAQALLADGPSHVIADRMVSFAERDTLVGLPAYARLEDELSRSPRPRAATSTENAPSEEEPFRAD